MDKARRHVQFVCSLYRTQVQQARRYLQERPWSALSLDVGCVREMLELLGSRLVQAHQCQFGLRVPVGNGTVEHALAKKPTGFMTSSRHIADQFSRKCLGDRQHVVLDGRHRTGFAAIYQKELCDAICRGIVREKRDDGAGRVCSVATRRRQTESCLTRLCSTEATTMGRHWTDNKHEDDGDDRTFQNKSNDGHQILTRELQTFKRQTDGLVAWDDVSAAPLDPKKVQEARQVEMRYVHDMGVYKRVPRSQLQATGGNFIDTKWIDINKGYHEHQVGASSWHDHLLLTLLQYPRVGMRTNR